MQLAASVIIPAHNAAATLSGQLRALRGQREAPSFEVIVVDNDSTDATLKVARAHESSMPGLRLASHVAAKGASPTRNFGARLAQSENLLFCDADDVVDEGWVAAMVQGLSRGELVGGPLLDMRLNDRLVRSWHRRDHLTTAPVAMGYLPFTGSGNLGVKREAFMSVGGFSDAFCQGHEDVDLCWRLQQAGARFVFSEAAAVHVRLRTTLRQTLRQYYGAGRSYAQLFAAHRRHGIKAGALRNEARGWLNLIRSAPKDLMDSDSRGYWLTVGAWQTGRLHGSVERRVVAPR